MAIENQGLLLFLACWMDARAGGALPRHGEVVSRMGRRGLPSGNRALLARTDGRILVREAGRAIAEHYGFDPTGADLLDLTPASGRHIRAQRFAAVVTVPCGMHVRDGMQTALEPGGRIEALNLPVRDDAGDDALVMSLHLGMETVAPSRGPIYLVESIEWIDLGAGVPASTTNPLLCGTVPSVAPGPGGP